MTPVSVLLLILFQFHHATNGEEIGRLPEFVGDINTLEVKEKILENPSSPHSGREKQPLKIFVVPHSHNDAGWGMTLENYYRARTQFTLNYLTDNLSQDPSLRLMWTEISFLDLWWQEQSLANRDKFKRLVDNKQVEMVGGGWVMPDEANVHYLAFITQIMEGHQWLHQRFGITPKNGWSIDPFGLSPSIAYLTHLSGIQSLTFLRIHYVMKELFENGTDLEFLWSQNWDPTGKTDIFSHVMPYDSYDSASSCGPNRTVCVDFTDEIMGRKPFNDSDASYLKQRSLSLLQQLRQKSELFQTNNLLFPLGGDFRYRFEDEWTLGFPHVKNVMDFVNNDQRLNAKMQLATVGEYLEAAKADFQHSQLSLKRLTGDFFTYSDLREDYWSGYYTSRIFHKVTERQLLASVRAMQNAFTLMTAEVFKRWQRLDFHFIQDLLPRILRARRTLGLFQHHDGITGTSSDSVVRDYANKMDKALRDSDFVIQQCLFVLMNFQRSAWTHVQEMENIRDTEYFTSTLQRNSPLDIWTRSVIEFNQDQHGRIITVFNSLAESRTELVRVLVANPQVQVLDMEGNEVASEIYPALKLRSSNRSSKGRRSHKRKRRAIPDHFFSDQVELVFRVVLPPLSTTNFQILERSPSAGRNPVEIRVSNPQKDYSGNQLFQEAFSFSAETSNSTKYDAISNDYLTLYFDQKGTVDSLKIQDKIMPLNIDFLFYSSYKSGLYLFGKSENVTSVSRDCSEYIVVKGKFQSYIITTYANVLHRITLHNHLDLEQNALEIENLVDIRHKKNYELVMRFSTPIQNENVFYTDSNGFQAMKRKFLGAYPTAGNYYPVSTYAFLEDSNLRMTLLSAQPGGGSSLGEGQFEIMLDRIVNQDDNRGIGQGGTDSVAVLLKHKLIFEYLQGSKVTNKKLPALSLPAQHQSHHFLFPPAVFVDNNVSPSQISDYIASGTTSPLIPCDVNVLGLFALPEYNVSKDVGNVPSVSVYDPAPEFGLSVNRLMFDERFDMTSLGGVCQMKLDSFGVLRVSDILGELVTSEIRETPVNFVGTNGRRTFPQDPFVLNRMELYSFVLSAG